MRISILKITNRDDYGEDPQYYTIKKLRDQVINEWYDCWVDPESETEITKENILESDEKLFDFMNEFGFNIEFILTITEEDL